MLAIEPSAAAELMNTCTIGTASNKAGAALPMVLSDCLTPSSGVSRSLARPRLTSTTCVHRLATASMLWLTNRTVRPSLTTSPILPRHFF